MIRLGFLCAFLILLASCRDPFVRSVFTEQTSYGPGDTVTFALDIVGGSGAVDVEVFHGQHKRIMSLEVLDTSAFAGSSQAKWADSLPRFSLVLPDPLLPGVGSIRCGDQATDVIFKAGESCEVSVVVPVSTMLFYHSEHEPIPEGGAYHDWAFVPEYASLQAHWNMDQYCKPLLDRFQNRDYNGLKFNYIADIDLARAGLWQQSKLLVILGRSEVWTPEMRTRFDAYVDQGGNALILSSRTMYWETEIDGQQLTSYRDWVNRSSLDSVREEDFETEVVVDHPISQSIGMDFQRGGFGKRDDQGWDGYRIVAGHSPLLEGTSLTNGDLLQIASESYDGAPLIGNPEQGVPELDLEAMEVHRAELIGYDLGLLGEEATVGTWVVLQKSPQSGIIVNMGTSDWGAKGGIESAQGDLIEIITRNAIEKLATGSEVFSALVTSVQ